MKPACEVYSFGAKVWKFGTSNTEQNNSNLIQGVEDQGKEESSAETTP